MTTERYRLIGSTASPYAIKLRALMRYRRIPFDWVIMTKALRKQTEHLRPNLIPVLQYPDGTFRGETTTLAYDLEARHSERSVIPQDKAVAFICDLLEDLADEWAVKPLFLYRWWDAEDQALRLALGRRGVVDLGSRNGKSGRDRRISPPANLADAHSRRDRGKQAAAGGELSPDISGVRAACRNDATICSAAGHRLPISPGSVNSARWQPIRRRCGSCGRRLRSPITGSGAWTTPQVSMANGIHANAHSAGGSRRCLRIAGELYLPFLVANAEAFANGLKRLEIKVWDLPYALAPFKYQVKCLQQLRDKFAALDARDRAALQPILARTGCWEPLAAA